jgi:putative chitinase
MLNFTEESLIKCAKHFAITDKLELSHLLGQCSHETGGFSHFTESFNYTPDGLIMTWATRFNSILANKLGRTPQHPADQQSIANTAYNGRMGNAVGSDDGYNYRGRGCIQCTGKYNYTQFQGWLYKQGYTYDIVSSPDLVASDINIAFLSAVWFWLSHNVGEMARHDKIVGVTRLINGGTRGLEDRKILTEKYKKILL